MSDRSSARTGQDDDPTTIKVVIGVRERLFADLLADRVNAEPDFRVAETCWQADELEDAVRRKAQDVLLLDPRVVADTGPAFGGWLRGLVGTTRLVVLVAHRPDPYVLDAIRAGCVAFARADRPAGDMIAALRDAHAGVPHMSQDLVAQVIDQFAPQETRATVPLTERELQVLSLVAEGRSTSALAEQLGVSINTVRHHVSNVRLKLGVHSKLEAVAVATRAGLIRPQGR